MRIEYISFNEGTPANGYWDQALLQDILAEPIFQKTDYPNGGIFILPGAYNGDHIDKINSYLSAFDWVILFITSDEESKFPVEKISHRNIKIWVNYPKGRHSSYQLLPLGYTLETRKNLKLAEKDIEVFYAGQKTHVRRELCSEALRKAEGKFTAIVYDTQGFTQGFSPVEYMSYMNRAKVVPAPSGAVSQDSFRLYEALEAGAIPIADDISPSGEYGYWKFLFSNPPFPILKDYDDLAGYIEDQLNNYQEKANSIFAWWLREKRSIRDRILSDFMGLTGHKVEEPVTVVIPVSYIPSHPDTHILAETIKSVRFHLPDSPIILTFDGIREEYADKKPEYDEFIRRALFLANTEWQYCYPLIFSEHVHQIGMARKAFDYIKSELILYVEQDTPLVTDEPIEWEKLKEAILTGESNMIRFHFEAGIPEPHKDLMIGKPENGLLKTVQWSQRPHLASTAFYRRILENNFSSSAKCFLEDVLHGKLMQAFNEDGVQGWNQWRVHIYYPNEKNIKRSLHLDGRQGALKYDDTQIW